MATIASAPQAMDGLLPFFGPHRLAWIAQRETVLQRSWHLIAAW
jgi:hypothetical protein